MARCSRKRSGSPVGKGGNAAGASNFQSQKLEPGSNCPADAFNASPIACASSGRARRLENVRNAELLIHSFNAVESSDAAVLYHRPVRHPIRAMTSPVDPMAHSPAVSERTPLPLPISPIIGREGELAALGDLLRRPGVRLITLMGPGGAGKTRLALHAADQARDVFSDIAFVPLDVIRDPDFVLPAIAKAIGLPTSESDDLFEIIVQRMRGSNALLLLDNAEQVQGAASILGELLIAVPSLTMLVTSRSPLGLYGEREFPVGPLSLPDVETTELNRLPDFAAIRLFIERAIEVNPAFRLVKENAGAVVEICRKLDGIPLAIELAAARIKLLSPSALLQRLTHRLHLLTSSRHDAPERQQTMRQAIAWSYDLLDSEQQKLFRMLGVFSGGFTIEAAETVAMRFMDAIS